MKKSRIILSSIISCLSLGLMSLTATLAWYATNDRLTVDSLGLKINGDLTLKVSASTNFLSFESEIDGKDFGPSATNFYFSPVSSIHSENWMASKTPEPVFYDYSFYGATASGEPNYQTKNVGFFSQKVYLLADTNSYVGLDIDKTMFGVNENLNLIRAQELHSEHPEWDMTVNEIKQELDNLIKALRVSILIPDPEHYQYVIIDPTKGPNDKTLFGGRLDNNSDGLYDSYIDFRDDQYEIVYGEVNNRELIRYDEPSGIPAVVVNKPQFFGNSFTAISHGNVHAYNAEKSLEDGLIIAEEPSISLEELNVANPPLQIPCYRDEPREIILSIYLEGWDVDCINETMGASFITKMSFQLLGRII